MPIAAEGEDDREAPDRAWLAGLGTVLREWGRIGVTGFGGPPAHIALLRRLCVEREGWLDAAEFEDAIAACKWAVLLPAAPGQYRPCFALTWPCQRFPRRGVYWHYSIKPAASRRRL